MTPFHQRWATYPLTGWSCLVLRCRQRGAVRAQACVLLVASVVMMLCAVVMALWE